MGESRQNTLDPAIIKNILTLRYNPTKKTLLPKLTWKNFVEKNANDPVGIAERLVTNTIEGEIGTSKQTKVSVALSGGIDSILILTLLRKTFPNIDIQAISVKFADSIDESPKAASIAEKFYAKHHIVYMENYLQELPKAISIIKLPFWDLHWYHVVKKAKSLSNILLSGDGGDELFGGYTFRYRKFLTLINRNSSLLEKVKAYLQCHERDWVPDQEMVFGKKAQFSWNEIYDTLRPYFDNPLQPIAQVFLADYNGKLLFNWFPLNTKFYKHFRVKAVTPLLSKRLISYAMHIPYSSKYDVKNNTGKILLRRLLSRYVGDKFVSNNKQGFSVNTLSLWKHYGRKVCDYYLSEARICRDGWINPNWIKQHITRLDGDKDVRYVNKFLGLLAFEIWYRLFVTQEMKSSSNLY